MAMSQETPKTGYELQITDLKLQLQLSGDNVCIRSLFLGPINSQ